MGESQVYGKQLEVDKRSIKKKIEVDKRDSSIGSFLCSCIYCDVYFGLEWPQIQFLVD